MFFLICFVVLPLSLDAGMQSSLLALALVDDEKVEVVRATV
jgi:hypothetical protein